MCEPQCQRCRKQRVAMQFARAVSVLEITLSSRVQGFRSEPHPIAEVTLACRDGSRLERANCDQ